MTFEEIQALVASPATRAATPAETRDRCVALILAMSALGMDDVVMTTTYGIWNDRPTPVAVIRGHGLNLEVPLPSRTQEDTDRFLRRWRSVERHWRNMSPTMRADQATPAAYLAAALAVSRAMLSQGRSPALPDIAAAVGWAAEYNESLEGVTAETLMFIAWFGLGN